jgi:hypothetical protein
MARSITLTLGAGLGADLGPNFDLTADVGVVTPSTATKTELTAGKSVSVDDAATQVTVTSTGTCTNAITQTIPCAGGTTTTTTTTSPPACLCYYILNETGGNLYYEYYDCVNGYTNDFLIGGASIRVCSSNYPSGVGLTIEPCTDITNCNTSADCTGCTTTPVNTTTTSTSTSTSTTTAAPSSVVYIYVQNISLDLTITDITVNGISVTYDNGTNFPVGAGNNGTFTSTQLLTQDVIIYYAGGHVPGQNVTFQDSDLIVTCTNTNGSGGSHTALNAQLTAGDTVYVTPGDGACV